MSNSPLVAVPGKAWSFKADQVRTVCSDSRDEVYLHVYLMDDSEPWKFRYDTLMDVERAAQDFQNAVNSALIGE